jgi:RNA polymerase sigma-70 factor (ECF subfamily)
MQPPVDERQLVAEARKGSKSAISLLYRTYIQRVFRYVSYRVDSDAVAEDVTAEVFLRMVQYLPQYRDTGVPFSAWLYRIAASQIADYHRQNKRIIDTEISDQHAGEDHDLLGSMIQEEERMMLRQAIQLLTEDQQTLLILRYMQRMSHQEVAVILNKSESAIRVMQHRALQALAQYLGGASKARSYLRRESRHG